MSIKALMDSFKRETVLLGPVQRYLLAQQEFDGDRARDVIHPSELVKPDVCDRAIYYRLSGWEIPREEHAFQLEVIFAAGHGYHDKWQNWAWGAGMLRGRYRCLACGHGDWSKPEIDIRWVTTSPDHCPKCSGSRYHLQYGEVPLGIPKHRIFGKADGDLDIDPDDDPTGVPSDPILEIKSIGDGTVRFEAPKLIARHTKRVAVDGEEKGWTDWSALWRDIRRPFPTHVKQVTLYCLAKEREEALFIYEYKPTGAVKEFRITPDPDDVEEELELALDIVHAVKVQKPPKCRHGGCAKCEAYEKLRDGAQDETDDGPEDREDPRPGAGDGAGAEEGTARPEEAPRRVPRDRSRGRLQRVERPRGDRGDAGVHSLGGLLERAGGTGGDHGGERGEDLPQDPGHRDAAGRRAQGTDPSRKGKRRVVRRSDRS